MAYFFEAICSTHVVRVSRAIPLVTGQSLLAELECAGEMHQRETKIQECQREGYRSHRPS